MSAWHGPIDLVRLKAVPVVRATGRTPTKILPEMRDHLAIAALECPDCGFEFPGREVKLEATASTLESAVHRQAAVGRRHRRHPTAATRSAA